MDAESLQRKLDAMRQRLAARFASLESQILAKVKGEKPDEKTANNIRRD